MNGEDQIRSAERFVENSESNFISKETAISDDVAGMRIYDAPIFAFGSADDKLFEDLKKPSAIGGQFMLPKEWLPGARTVISFFLPFSETVKKGNSRDMSWPSSEWLHGRVEGQAMLIRLCEHLNSALADAGYRSVVLPWTKGSGPTQARLSTKRNSRAIGPKGMSRSSADSARSGSQKGS
jgi:epoxyqueuosine reductase